VDFLQRGPKKAGADTERPRLQDSPILQGERPRIVQEVGQPIRDRKSIMDRFRRNRKHHLVPLGTRT